MLLQQTATKLFLTSAASSLLYVGLAQFVDRMRQRIPNERLFTGGTLTGSASYRDVVDEVVTGNTAAIFGFNANEEGERAAVQLLNAILVYVIEHHEAMPDDAPVILALDDLASFAPRGEELSNLLDRLDGAFDSGGSFIPIFTFQGFFILERLFGIRGLDLFSRLGDLVLLGNRTDERAITLAKALGNTDLRTLPQGRALLISHAGLEFPFD